ncbi:MAG: bactofilin family protein [Chloroflexota bacterium]
MEYPASDTAARFEGQEGFSPSERSYIDPATTISGEIRTERDLRIEGRAEGQITCEGVLTIAEGATVDAEIVAASIIVAGEMSGKVRCRGRLEIRSTGMVRGDVKTGALVIVEGARYEGQIAMETPEGAIDDGGTDGERGEEEPRSYDPSDNFSFLRRFSHEDDEESEDDKPETPLV